MKWFKEFFRKWNELLAIPLAIVLWLYSGDILRWMDPTAATFDSGILQIYLFAIIGLLFFSGFSWLYVKLNWPIVYYYFNNNFDDEFLWDLTSYQRIWLAVYLFSLPFILAVVLANAL